MLAKWRAWVKQLKQETYALYLAYHHPDTPLLAKIWVLVVVAYAFSPIDLIPDFIPVLGYLDDLLLVPLGIALAIKLIPDEVMQACRAEAAQATQDSGIGQVGAVVIVAIWLLVAVLLARWLL